MDKRILYVGGGFDILHQDHKRFILKGINLFKKKFGNLQKIIIGLKSDINLKKIKGKFRPFFSYEWRKEDISNFLKKLGIEYQIIESSGFFSRYKNRNDIVAEVRSDNVLGINQMKDFGITTILVKPINQINTSDFEKRLFEVQKKSNCNIRKVGALLIRQGKIITEGYSGVGNCSSCLKYLAYKKGKRNLSKTVECDYPHAEAVVLKKAKKKDDILITDSPCQKCAELILRKGIGRVVYINEYHDLEPLVSLNKGGVKVRKN